MSAGCLPMLAMWPIMLAFWWVMREPGKYIFSDPAMYATIQKNFFWIKDLGLADPYLYGMPLINAALQFITMKLMMPPSDSNEKNPMATMIYVFPLIIFISAKGIPAGAFLYWMTSNIVNTIIRLLLPLPHEIRAISSYNPTLAIPIEGTVTQWLGKQRKWGVTAGLKLENKGMITRSRVKNYRTEIIGDGGEKVSGRWTGYVKTKMRTAYLTIPLLAAYRLDERKFVDRKSVV